MKQKEITLFSQEVYYTGIETEYSEYHGNLVKFIQAFPDPLLGHSTHSVAIREKDIDKVIEFLQSLKANG